MSVQSDLRRVLLAVIAADIGQRLRSTFEICAVLAIVMLLVSLAARDYEEYLAKAEIAEAFTLILGAKTDLITHRAQTGRWPEDKEVSAIGVFSTTDDLGRFISRMTLNDGGAVDTWFDGRDSSERLANRRTTFRFARATAYDGAPYVLICAGHPQPPDTTTSGLDKTTVNPDDLPSICKGP